MRAILIPVKEFHEAKKRLAPHFSPADRAALAEAMCDDFFRVVAATRCATSFCIINTARAGHGRSALLLASRTCANNLNRTSETR